MRRFWLLITALAAVFGGWPSVVRLLFHVPSIELSFFMSLFSTVLAIAWVLKTLVHIRPPCRYHRSSKEWARHGEENWRGRRAAQRRLNLLVKLDFALFLVWFGESVELALRPVLWIQCLASFVLAGCAGVVASETYATAVEVLNYPTGSAAVDSLPPVRWLKGNAERVPGVRKIVLLFGNRTGANSISLTALAAIFGMVGIFLVEAPKAGASGVKELVRLEQRLTGHHHHPQKRPSDSSTTTSTSSTLTAPTSTVSTPTVTTPTATTTPTTTSNTTTAPAPTPTPTMHCGIYPGAPAPNPWRDAIHTQVKGSAKRHRNGLGENVTGCLQRAFKVRHQVGLYAAVGTCGAKLRSLVIARADGTAVTLIQAPADFAFTEALEGRLIWAGPRMAIEHGNLQVIDTLDGAFTFERQESSTGPIYPNRRALWCDQFTSGNVAYTKIPPALGVLALEVMQRLRHWVWVEQVSSLPGTRDGTEYLLEDDISRQVIGSASCRSVEDCTLHLEPGGTSSYSGRGVVTTDEWLEFAPPAVK